MTDAEIQKQILRYISRTGAGRQLVILDREVRKTALTGSQIEDRQIREGVWSLIRQGLAYLDYSRFPAEHWELQITANGRAVVSDERINPDDQTGYIQNLDHEVPDLSEVAKNYAHEALYAYNVGLYRSSVVMLGVASEAAVLEVAAALAQTMREEKKQQYLEQLEAPNRSYNAKFEDFRQKLRSRTDSMPEELTTNLDLTMNSVGELLRVYRNNAGHPTGKVASRHDCFTFLHMFVQYAKRLYAIKAHLENLTTPS